MSIIQPIFIYIFKLETGKYFIHEDVETSILQMLLQLEIEYDFIKEFPIITLYKQIEKTNDFQLDNTVKKYMVHFGISNVRGGSYTEIELPEYSIKALNNEFNTILNMRTSHLDTINEIIQKYGFTELSREEIHRIREELNHQLQQYSKEKENLTNISYYTINGLSCTIDNSLIEDIEWLNATCNTIVAIWNNQTPIENSKSHFYMKIENKDICDKYKRVIESVKEITKIFLTKINPEFICDTNLLHPEFIFDDFFYHKHRITCESSIQNMNALCNKYKLFVNTIINKKMEYEFDVNSWNPNFEWKITSSIYLLNNIESHTADS